MASRGHLPYEGRSIQAPGMMRHGPFPGGPGPAIHHRPLEPLPPRELILEDKMASQAAEMDRLLRENQRLAGTHVALRQDLVATQQEMQRIEAHVKSVNTESDIQVRGLLEKIGKMEADILAGEMLKKELQQAHMEAQSLLTARKELTAEIQLVTDELQKINADAKNMPELHAELNGLRQEHQKLRAAFEYEKGSNMEQVEQMRSMEKNLISLAREVEKLRAEVANAEKGARVPNSYGGSGTYSSPDPVYPPAAAGQGSGYMAGGYGHDSSYSNAGYGHGGPASYPQAYGRSQPQMTTGLASVNGAAYSDGYGRPQSQMSSGAPVVNGASYSDGYGRPQSEIMSSGAAVVNGASYSDGYGGVHPQSSSGAAAVNGASYYDGYAGAHPQMSSGAGR